MKRNVLLWDPGALDIGRVGRKSAAFQVSDAFQGRGTLVERLVLLQQMIQHGDGLVALAVGPPRQRQRR